MELDVLATPGQLISLPARGFARLSESRLKPLGSATCRCWLRFRTVAQARDFSAGRCPKVSHFRL
jgi:hypothetical protein